MSNIFQIYHWTSAPATITYDDDDNLIDVVLNLGTRGTYTYKTDLNPSGNLHPFAGQVFYERLDALVERAETHYELRTGGNYAVVTLGDSEQPSTAVVVSHNARITPKKFDQGGGDWTLARSKVTPSKRDRFAFQPQSLSFESGSGTPPYVPEE
ncbi:unnamed protein product [Rhizoctonia solani]|uniref:Uncharacterized protein n=1 Tax=Rhizoctonia solani TaxID=456999 RepID=A0A8H3HI44_9AGAM|nr:unnamed protein product [Rhizoctonia solani]CAE7213458.1 unnamed protein product [Rhizoctonia solani]